MAVSKKTKKYAKKLVGRLSLGAIFSMIICLVIGVGSGVLTYSVICKNDKFEILGDKEISLAIGQSYSYSESGVEIISFGKDISDKVVIQSNIPKVNGEYVINTSVEIQYYISYTVDDLKYGNIQKVRLITVGE